MSEKLRSLFFPDDSNVRKLSDEENKRLQGKITEMDCTNVIKSMQNGKSPGLDGFPIEFYKVFWSDIKVHLLNALNAGFETGKLSTTQRAGVLTLLSKKESDPLQIKNKRPISLLNVDYKIATKVIASRIKNVLPLLINEDQTGYVKSRYIGENIRLILDLIELTDTMKIPGRLAFIDFEKAFDSLEWEFIFKTLKYFNLGHDIIRWVKVFYTEISSCIINNGVFSKTFDILRGVRQGCPLSPYLFVLCVEILAIAIRRDTSVKGINIQKQKFHNSLMIPLSFLMMTTAR